MQLTISPDALNSPAPALGPEPAAWHPWLVALCLLGYLLFCLQQVVIGHGMGVGLSLGSMAIRAFAIGFTLALCSAHRWLSLSTHGYRCLQSLHGSDQRASGELPYCVLAGAYLSLDRRV